MRSLISDHKSLTHGRTDLNEFDLLMSLQFLVRVSAGTSNFTIFIDKCSWATGLKIRIFYSAGCFLRGPSWMGSTGKIYDLGMEPFCQMR